MITVTAQRTAHKGQEAALKAELMQLIEACKEHQGLLLYSVHQHVNQPEKFIFYEQFADETALKAHLQSPELTQSADRRKVLSAHAQVDTWQRLAATGPLAVGMDTFEALHTRRSIRKFTDRPLSEHLVRDILAAGMAAPSAGNTQPWEFVVLRESASKKWIGDHHPYAKMAEHAPVSVLVCGDLSKEKYAGVWVQDCSAATQNILVAARALGIGSVWCGIYPLEDRIDSFRRAFNLPDTIQPLCLVAMGWPDQPFTRRHIFDENKIHQETF